MKSSQIMIVTAMLLAVALAGFVISDEAEAADGEYNVTYSINGSTIVESTTDGAYTFKPVDEVLTTYKVPTGYDFTGWKDVNSPTVYSTGTEYTLTGDITVEPYLTVTGVVISFAYGDETYTLPGVASDTIGEGVSVDAEDIKAFAERAGLTYTDAPEDDASDILKMLSLTGYEFKGFSTEGSDKLITELEGLTVTNAASDVVYIAVFEPVYTVTFVVDGTTISTQMSNDIEVPVDPSKPNYTFDGWFDASGVEYSEKYTYTADTTFTAKFEANLVEVTYMVGDEVYDIVEVRYGGTASNLALPSGYMAWAIDAEGTAAFDFTQPITAAITIYAVEAPIDESYYVTFNIEGTNYGPYQVNDRFSIPNTDRDGYIFAGWVVEGGDGTKLTNEQVNNYEYAGDVTFIATYDPAPAPEGPGFFQTTAGQAVLVILFFAILAFVACYVMNYGGLKDKLSGIRIVRVKKE